jgi:arylsulfatase A-like enzyme
MERKLVASLIIYLFLALNGLYSQINSEHPNILWVVCEDISPTLSMYGDSTAKTPHLDELASMATVYANAFTTAGVCAPSRSALITGVHQTAIGTMHMRTGKDVFAWGKREYAEREDFVDIQGDSLRQYAVVIPEEVKCFPEYLRREGYYCTNNAKTDYQFAAPRSAWDENGNKAHWRNRDRNQPFFSVFNIGLTHESRLWRHRDKELTVDPEEVSVPPYLPNTEKSRIDVARHYSNVELMDREVGRIIDELKEDGLYENTIIFFYSDHGGPLPRQKRELFDSGLHVPLIIKMPGQRESRKDAQLISFLDFAPTILSLAGIDLPAYMEGRAFLGQNANQVVREFIFAGADRLDERTDRVRAIRDKEFLYIRNYFSDRSHYEDLGYRKNIPMMQEMLVLKEKGQLNAAQEIWFQNKDWEELYDCKADPHNMNNLVDDPNYREVLSQMRERYRSRLQQYPDLGTIPEAQWIDMMWPDGQQPKTALPHVEKGEASIQLEAATAGSSIVYLFSDEKDLVFDFDLEWQLYSEPLIPGEKQYLYAIAERIGFERSDMIRVKL